MSDSDSDEEFKDLFDAFDEVKEETDADTNTCAENESLHGKKFDPYAPKMSIKDTLHVLLLTLVF